MITIIISCQCRCAVKTIAKFHAVGICHKMMLLQSFEAQVKAAEQKKTFEDIEVEGETLLDLGETPPLCAK